MSDRSSLKDMRYLKQLLRDCKKDPGFEAYFSGYTEQLNEEYGKGFKSMQLLIDEYLRVKKEGLPSLDESE